MSSNNGDTGTLQIMLDLFARSRER